MSDTDKLLQRIAEMRQRPWEPNDRVQALLDLLEASAPVILGCDAECIRRELMAGFGPNPEPHTPECVKRHELARRLIGG